MERIICTEYEIRVRGCLDRRWSEWFDGFTIAYPAEGETLLSGTVADQAALHGLLAKIWDLGLSLISVQHVDRKEDGHERVTEEGSADDRL